MDFQVGFFNQLRSMDLLLPSDMRSLHLGKLCATVRGEYMSLREYSCSQKPSPHEGYRFWVSPILCALGHRPEGTSRRLSSDVETPGIPDILIPNLCCARRNFWLYMPCTAKLRPLKSCHPPAGIHACPLGLGTFSLPFLACLCEDTAAPDTHKSALSGFLCAPFLLSIHLILDWHLLRCLFLVLSLLRADICPLINL